MRPALSRPLLPALLLAGLLPTWLSACAPRVTAPPAPTFRAAFSPEGVAWVAKGVACVARAPEFAPVCPPLTRGQVQAIDVAWNGGDAWAALPELGQIVTLDRAARSLTVGAVTALSRQAIYRQDGSVLDYSGAPAGQITASPIIAATGGDGLDYAMSDQGLIRVRDDVRLEKTVLPELMPTPQGLSPSPVPAVQTPDGIYRVQNGALERLSAAGQLLGRVPEVSGKVGQVGALIVVVSPGGQVRRFTPDLTELP